MAAITSLKTDWDQKYPLNGCDKKLGILLSISAVESKKSKKKNSKKLEEVKDKKVEIFCKGFRGTAFHQIQIH